MSVWWFLTSMSNKEDADKYKKALEEKDKEIERLNNIINELAFIFDDYNEFNEILEKYNYELKGSE